MFKLWALGPRQACAACHPPPAQPRGLRMWAGPCAASTAVACTSLAIPGLPLMLVIVTGPDPDLHINSPAPPWSASSPQMALATQTLGLCRLFLQLCF